jgi:hypothetical protein
VLRRLAASEEVGSVLLELTVAEQRFNAVMEVLRDGRTVIEVAELYGVSRQTVHGWLRRYRTGGLDALADRGMRVTDPPHDDHPEQVRHEGVDEHGVSDHGIGTVVSDTW